MRRLWGCLLLMWSGIAAGAGLETEQAHSKALLVNSHTALVPGHTITFALRIQLEPGWHVYWRNPGDSASAPIISPELPDGYTASEIRYGIPKRIPLPPLMSFGYEEETYYGIDVTIPEQERDFVGQERTFTFVSEWLVCKEECIPAFFDFVMTLPVALSAEPTEHAVPLGRVLDAVDEQTPLVTGFHRKGDQVIIEAPEREGQWIDVFPEPQMPLKNGAREMTADGAVLQWNEMPSPPLSLSLLGVWSHEGELVAQRLVAQPVSPSILAMIGFALVGGFILNLMPCVFPVLMLKLMAVVKSREQSRRGVVVGAFAYQAGILVSMWGLALALLIAREAGEAFGWGFQLQTPWFVAALAVLFFLIGLNFMGVFELYVPFAGAGQSLTTKEGWLGSFFTGVLAVIVASPCTAPFMGVAIGYALSQSAGVSFLVFGGLGLGLGLPYLVLGFVPSLTRFLPRPGPWMVTLKELMAFPIWATVIWLLYVYGQQRSSLAVAGLLVLLLLCSLMIWGWKRFGMTGRLTVVTIAVGLATLTMHLTHPAGIRPAVAAEDDWEPYSKGALAETREAGKPVFINFTAAWCISCQVNDQTTFQTESVKQFVAERGIVMMKADYTHHNPEIGNTLKEYNRAGVPLYLYFPVGGEQAVILPEVLTPQIFTHYIENES